MPNSRRTSSSPGSCSGARSFAVGSSGEPIKISYSPVSVGLSSRNVSFGLEGLSGGIRGRPRAPDKDDVGTPLICVIVGKAKSRMFSQSLDSSCTSRTFAFPRSEEHTSELQSQSNLVCRLLLEKKKK